MLAVADVDAARGGRTLLRGLSHLAAGERLAVIGPNGAGKSSLLHTLIGDHAPARGDIRVGGRPLTALGDRERACRLALLPQASTLDFPFTVDEVVALGRTPHASGAVADRAVIEAVCAATDIDHLRRRLYPRLSGGEKQRVQLARVLAQIWRPRTPVSACCCSTSRWPRWTSAIRRWSWIASPPSPLAWPWSWCCTTSAWPRATPIACSHCATARPWPRACRRMSSRSIPCAASMPMPA